MLRRYGIELPVPSFINNNIIKGRKTEMSCEQLESNSRSFDISKSSMFDFVLSKTIVLEPMAWMVQIWLVSDHRPSKL